ncbi:SDR family NAD(P)-dependent oxidoreductase [Mycetocola reblochoni]|uniref:3-oxoacyl-[acyl-carrier protein] reductase n=2 Tax=Mycetocola reblochoni TaxID=331618 RepID=A0A1R4KD35_9MICO|nr:SDR family oxidoreductase [Mycetocola reblochoni]RLP71243.1 SDR family oxidoreductase [Mycetocola reblochoni]SJN42220.1 3-oxoacyl-[acyl-carrier protein] reductase [Mycetocola reblochoni REB411]
MDLNIADKTALITGADSGIGWETARLLLAEGATVFLTDVDEDSLAEAAARLSPKTRVHHAAADITSVDEVAALHAAVQEAVGDIDILVQSAGVTGAQGLFHEITDEGWTKTIETDLIGPVRLIREFLPELRSGGWGRLVLLASEDAVQPYDDELPYCAAKAGILALAKGLSRSYAREGLLVNAVSPAFIHTPMTDAMMQKRSAELGVSFDAAIESFLDEQRPYMELGRRGEPQEVAAVIAFLCSDLASFVNGSNYRVDSGSVATI